MGSRRPGIRGWAFLLATAGLAFGLVALFASGSASAEQTEGSLPYASHLAALAGDSSGAPQLVLATATATHSATSTNTSTTTATPSATATPPGQTCSSGHGLLLGFGDAGVASVTRTPLDTTVGALRTLAGPSPLPTDAGRIVPFETTVYSLTASLVSMSQLSDGTIVLLVGENAGGATVPVLFPPRSCTHSADPSDQGAISSSAIALRVACGDAPAPGAAPVALAGSATLTGTGFWNSASIDGAPGNGASLGPVLSFSFSGGSCDPNKVTPTPTPSPTPRVQKTNVGTVDAPVNNAYTAGDPITVQASIIPEEPGISCSFLFVGPLPGLAMLQGPTLDTDASGHATWSFTIPSDTIAGDARVTAYCGMVPATTTIHIKAAS
ncbi:MAG TPA: hypothetical protein VN697_05065 [Tepidiformaceae bacterium]|nr:hypothetical protein [Tepidiformaceae bacterium]